MSFEDQDPPGWTKEDELQSSVDQWYRQYQESQKEIEQLKREIHRLKALLEKAGSRLKQLRADYNALTGNTPGVQKAEKELAQREGAVKQ